MNTTTTKLQFRHTQNNLWANFPQAPTVDNFNNEFPAEFMRSYYYSNYIAWEQDLFMLINDECTQKEFKAKDWQVKNVVHNVYLCTIGKFSPSGSYVVFYVGRVAFD